MFIAGTSAPVKKTIWEPERQDNPFLPRLPEPKEVPALPEPTPVFVPEWLDPNRVPEPQPVFAPVFTTPEREPVPVRVRR